MSAIILTLILIVIFIVIKVKNRVNKVNLKLDSLIVQVKNLGAVSAKLAQNVQTIQVASTVKPAVKPMEKPAVSKVVPSLKEIPPTKVEKAKEDQGPVPRVVEYYKPKPVQKPIVYQPMEVVNQSAPKKTKKPAEPSFMERNPDLEKFIGENLLSKIGIIIFVTGMGFLVKLGIDSNVITEGMRVAIGVLIGGGLIGLGHNLRKSFEKFSSILIGGALSVLYFTIALAFHEYHLIPQTAAFFIMVFITAFAVLLSISYDRKILSILALIGGFCTPFFVSIGDGNLFAMLGYILILDIGMLALVYFKKWNVINYLTYAFTYILFSGMFISEMYNDESASTGEMFGFLAAFYLIFFLMTIIYNVVNNVKFKSAEIGMLLSNSALYFGFGLAIIGDFSDGLYNGLFTGLVAVFNFAFTYVLFQRKNIDKNLLYY
jgi:uncharacterized membrane protein